MKDIFLKQGRLCYLCKLFAVTGLLNCIIPAEVAAELIFARTELKHSASVGEAAFSGIFSFRNAGTQSVILLGAAADCDCTVPEFEKAEYAPGESGIITVTFNYQSRNGEQHKSVVLKTDEGDYVLSLIVVIPEFWKLTPEVLLWQSNGNLEEKEIRIEFPEQVPVEITLGAYRENRFAIELTWTAGSDVCMLKAKPKTAERDLIQRVYLQVRFEKSEAISIPIGLRVINE